MLDFKAKLIRLQSQTVNHLPVKEKTDREGKGQEIDSEDRISERWQLAQGFPFGILKNGTE